MNSENFCGYRLNMCYSCIIISYKIKFRDRCYNFQTTQDLSWDIEYFDPGRHNINSWSDLQTFWNRPEFTYWRRHLPFREEKLISLQQSTYYFSRWYLKQGKNA